MKRILSVLFLLMTIHSAYGQVGSIQGKVLDEKGVPVPFVTVVLVSDEKGSNPTNPAKTNIDGFYSIKPLNPGRYNVMVKMLGYQPEILTGIEVAPNKPTEVKIKLEKALTKTVATTVIRAKKFEKPILDKKETSTGVNVTDKEIKQLATRDVNSIAASQGGVYQEDEGGGINIAGAQSAGTQVMIDGMKVSSNAKLPPSAIGQLQVITGGVPARYGDLSGGVISITTKDPAKEFNGGIEAITSNYLDPWGYNLLNAYLSGPLIVKKDSVTKTKKSILGYFVTGEVQYQKDRYLTSNGIWKVKDADYEAIKKDPFLFSTDGQRILQRAELINASNLERISSHQNTKDYQYRLQGKLDYKISEDFSLTASGAFDINRYNQYIERYSLFNFENNPAHFDRTYRGFVRFRHNIGAAKANAPSTDADKTAKKSAVQNAFYIAQFDFEKVQNDYFDPKHEFNPFNYGHVGYFDRLRAPTLEHKRNEKVFFGTGPDDYIRLEGFFILNDKDTGINYTPGKVNPLAAGLTDYYLNLVKNAGLNKETYYGSLTAIEQNNGLVNGNRANNFINDLYYPFGRAYNGMARDADNEQYRFRFDGSFDVIKTGSEQNMHSIEYGFEYEQRVLRKYTISPITLWRMASLYTNNHISRNPKDLNPLLTLNEGRVKMHLQDYITQINNGVDTLIFYTSDTVEYEAKATREQQSNFSRKLRSSLGLNPDGNEFVNTDALDPSQLRLDFFTPDEMLDAWGLNLVQYEGYDPYGNRLSTNPSFNDFFTKKVNGVYTREVGAFKPIYFAGYIQDKFQFKDLTFNVGVRIDRFDANQKVLRDKYSLYATHKIGDFGPGVAKKFTDDVENALRNAPSNLSSNAVVYVDKAIGPTKVTGYRDGDFWYDNKGNLIGSPAAIISASGGNIQPLLLVQNERANNMIDSSFNPDNTFTDYSPIWNIMPRLQFSFPVTEKSIFFAHYDVLTQRPYQDVLLTSPMDWYLAFGKNFTSFINNPNLKMQKTIDFQLGFKQELTKYLGLTISTFYREFKDQIQITKIIGAYPKDYLTFENLDFGTSKGGQIDLEMRPYARSATDINNLRLKVAYTLSFAEGTGSDTRTQFSIIEGGNTNLRLINPLNYDARHTFVVSADYHFPSANDPNYNGPVIGKSKILADFGINIQSTLRTGTPYTKQANVLPDAKLTGTGRATTEGSINSARLPMSFRINLKVDKSFKVKFKNANEAEGIKAKYFDFNVYVQIKNLLNTDNVLGVYRYTGNPDEDGYLTSALGKIDIQSKENQLAGRGQSFIDLYKVALEQPTGRTSFYSQPRTIQLGVSFSF